MKQIEKQKLLDYLKYTPHLIDHQMIERVTMMGVDAHKAYIIYLSLLCGFEENEELLNSLQQIIVQLDEHQYMTDYFDCLQNYKQIEFQKIPKYQCVLLNQEPLSAGYYTKDILYPKYNDFMINPCYINAIEKIIDSISGVVTLFGFGLGYLAYRLKETNKVDYIHIYERDLSLYSNFNDVFGCLGIVSLNELDDEIDFEIGDTIIIDQSCIDERTLQSIQSKLDVTKKILYVK